MSAVPANEATANDFMQIRAALVRRLGSANAALVWSRVFYRANPGNPNAYERDGVMWWRATRDVVADETGLNPGQARRTLESLEEAGFLIAEKHHLEGNYDQAKSYRPNVVDTANDLSSATNESSSHRASAANVDRASAANVDRASATNVPTTKTPQELEDNPLTPGDPGGLFEVDGVFGMSFIDAAFERAWKAYPNPNNKKQARAAWVKAVKRIDVRVLTQRVEEFGAAWAATGKAAGFTPYMQKWLNEDRWENPLPVVEHQQQRSPGQEALGIIELGRQMAEQEQQRSIGS